MGQAPTELFGLAIKVLILIHALHLFIPVINKLYPLKILYHRAMCVSVRVNVCVCVCVCVTDKERKGMNSQETL